ncbi:hypothetical protein CFN78_06210 [Amycolatopsis antarctica]|uniref:Uncharacterized protein n=1 Tax=Amycolatopsis antarctica TaxID=1854586 RepID=A0A263D790_9PSEU|nr:hypothetical protein [Amycolatopsis antarctica]OZM73888.1 hypothetical protein CFN78_06210 [Amycolatopsis antarctica]
MTATPRRPASADKLGYYRELALGPAGKDRKNARDWLRRHGFEHLIPSRRPAGTERAPAPEPVVTRRVGPGVCRVDDHVNRACHCFPG